MKKNYSDELQIRAVIFDLGGVLIDWNPRYVYREVFELEEKMNWFLENVCNMDWNEQQDAGYPIAKAIPEKIAEFPEWEKEIRIYYDRWTEMLREPIAGTVDIFWELRRNAGLKFYALTNWSAELFPHALEKYEFLGWFDGIVVSGLEKMRKPELKLFRLLLERYEFEPAQALFIDDSKRNVDAAKSIGMKAIHFESPTQLREALQKIRMIV